MYAIVGSSGSLESKWLLVVLGGRSHVFVQFNTWTISLIRATRPEDLTIFTSSAKKKLGDRNAEANH